MRSSRRLLIAMLLALVPLGVYGCDRTRNDVTVQNPAAPDPTDPPPADTVAHRFEFRITGTLPSVEVRATSAVEGTTVTITDLPWFYAFKSKKDPMFLSAQATGTGLGRVQVQIFVDGVVFREAVASGWEPIAIASGSWSSTTAARR